MDGDDRWRTPWPRIAALHVVVVAPGIIAFAFARRLFFKGLMEGVTKG
jgi:ABC-type glycerol-3-phosphate transport system permease component